MGRICQRCGEDKTAQHYMATNSIFFDGTLPICRKCLEQIIDENADDGRTWNIMNKICQWADVPFIPEEWEKIYAGSGSAGLGAYFSIFRQKEYEKLDWTQYNDVYLKIQEEQRVEDALPELKQEQARQLRRKWGSHYDDEELEYLENLHQGLINSQNIMGTLNEDQAMKLCKISLIIEDKIRAGQDISKDLKAYSDLSELANLTVQSVKDANDFSSLGEIFAFLEKKGWKNEYYDDTTRDEIDFSIKDIKNWLRYLYVNESGIAEEIEQRIENLKVSDKMRGQTFNEIEFRTYMQEQDDYELNSEEFDPDI